MSASREDLQFEVAGTRLAGWWYEPEQRADDPSPCIVMAHGLGGTRDAGLEPFAERFAQAGFPVFLFDYRHFGASDGEPRQLLSIPRQLADWAGAIAFVRQRPGIDPDRVALWGSSFSGGHVVVAAARDGRVAAASAQGPMMDGLAAVTNMVSYAGVGQLARISAVALRDQLGGLAGRDPVYAPIVGRPGELAAMSSDDAYEGYQAIAPNSWRNEMSARLALHLPLYRPIRYARKLKCPLLVIACMEDSVAPARAAVKTAQKAGARAELKEYQGVRHFDIYRGDAFERASADQLAFFRQHLLPG